MAKTFSEVVEEKTTQLFRDIQGAPHLTSFIVTGAIAAVSAHLRKELMETESTSATLDICDLMSFTLEATKKGDSVAFIPSFKLLEEGQKIVEKDDVDFSIKDLETYAQDIMRNTDFIDDCTAGIECKVFTDNGWEDLSTKNNEHGIRFSAAADTAIATIAVFSSIIEILANYKSASETIEYEIPSLGKFTVKPDKDTYTVGLTFDKEFKSNCKSDKLAEKFAAKDF